MTVILNWILLFCVVLCKIVLCAIIGGSFHKLFEYNVNYFFQLLVCNMMTLIREADHCQRGDFKPTGKGNHQIAKYAVVNHHTK